MSVYLDHRHNTHCHARGKVNDAGTISESVNVASVTNTTAGEIVITFTVNFSSADFACVALSERANSTTTVTNSKKLNIKSGTQAVSGITLQCWDSTATNNVIEDPAFYHFACFGHLGP